MFKALLPVALIVSGTWLPAQAQSVPERWRAGFDAVNQELNRNLKRPSRNRPFHSVRPSPKYNAVYLWDSAFIALIWKHRDRNISQDVIRSVIFNQQSDGRVPHVVSILGTSEWSQPPLLTWAAMQFVSQPRDLAFAREVYPKLKRYHEWLFAARRHSNGLFFWQHAYESGIDNAPRFGNRDESRFDDTRRHEAIDLSSYVVMDSDALKAMAEFIIQHSDNETEKSSLRADAQRYQAQSAQIAALVRERLWDEESGNFYDLDQRTNRHIKISTIASLLPLTAGIASPEQARRLMTRISDPRAFNTPIPFPTVERREETFEKDCWRGPVWINTAYMIIQGMKRYGFTTQAREMAARLVDGVYVTWHHTGKFVEYYDPERYDFRELTRKRGTGPLGLSGSRNPMRILEHAFLKQVILGTQPVDHFVGWTGLVNNLVLEENLTPPPNAPELPLR